MDIVYKNSARSIHQYWLFMSCICLLGINSVYAENEPPLSGRQIMEEVYQRHEQFPYVYEEQIMILVDKAGNRDTRKLRRYSRMTGKNKVRYMLLFDDPPEVRGVGLLTIRLSAGETETSIYLPAYGPELISSIGQRESSNFLGTDFSVRDLMPEVLDDFRYQRQDDEVFNEVGYFVVDVYESDPGSTHLLHRRYINQENFYITRTDTFDRHGRLHKRQTHHDLKFLGGSMWRANMIRMVDYKTEHESLIKIVRRIFSQDYVPENLFTLEWLVNNQRMAQPEAVEETHPDNKETEVIENDGKDITYRIGGNP